MRFCFFIPLRNPQQKLFTLKLWSGTYNGSAGIKGYEDAVGRNEELSTNPLINFHLLRHLS